METVGSQKRQDLNDDSGYIQISAVDNTGGVILFNEEENKYERWQKNDDFAGFVIVIEDEGFEFVRTMEKGTKCQH